MKKLFMGLLFMPVFCFAQTVKVNISNEFKVDDGDNFFKSGDNYYSIKTEANMQLGYTFKLSKVVYYIKLHKYDNQMNEIQTNELENGEKKFGPFAPQLFNFNNTLLLFYYKYYDGDTVRLYVSQIDQKSLNISTTKEVFSFAQKNFGFFKALSAQEDDNHLFICSSPDSGKLLVAHSNTVQIASCIIDKNLAITQKTFSPCPQDVKDFLCKNAFVDNNGNKYISYELGKKEDIQSGVFMQNAAGKEAFSIVNIGQGDYKPAVLDFKNSRNNSKIYLFGAYRNSDVEFEEYGVLLSEIDAPKLKISTPKLYAYSDDVKKRLYDLDFGDKHKGEYSVGRSVLTLGELDNGTIAIIGFPTHYELLRTINYLFAGPIIATLINNGKNNTAIIPRGQGSQETSGCVFVTVKNNIVCIYTDLEKNLDLDVNSNKLKKADPDFAEELVLASATINGNGEVINRTKIADRQGGRNIFYMNEVMDVSDDNFIIPIGRSKATMSRFYTELVKLANVEVQ